MKTNGRKFLVVALLFVVITACDKPGPAESAGKDLDRAVENAGNKINETVDKMGGKFDAQSAKMGVAIDDAEITSKIKTAILAEQGLNVLQISVSTLKGEVSLSGSVDSQAHRDMATALSGAVNGVTKVNNRLIIKPINQQ